MAEIGAAGTGGGYGQSAGRIESGGQLNPWQQQPQPQPIVASVAPWVIIPSYYNMD